jgi:ABC-type dipeptide/oligopeptide/nickel transport system permease component
MLYLEGWSDLMYDSMHSVSASMPVYWVLLVIVLAFGLNRQVIPRLVALVACSQFLFDFTCFYFHFSAIICSSIVIHQQYAQHFLGRDV